jgi:hypothetical protein
MKGFLQYGENIVLYGHHELDDEVVAKLAINDVNYDYFNGFLSAKG